MQLSGSPSAGTTAAAAHEAWRRERDAGGPQISSHEPDCGAVCPVHGTDHRDAGGWVQVHTPLHPEMPEPFYGRSCVTKRAYITWLWSRP